MSLKKIKVHPYLIPKPVAIIGANIEEKANFLTIADLCTTGYKIPRFVISSGKGHYTNKGILENKEFSVTIPSSTLVKEADYVGIKSGKKVDKSKIFDIFYGELKYAPLIKNAPITHSCELVENVDFGDTHYLFIGEIKETYVNEKVMEGRIPDIKKVDAFSYYYDNNYYSVGNVIAQAYKVGKELE
ncbi:MAG: flavin reductase family protein [Candidatus Lokiarchaeota archaeon]|nr:flavin reductase family protein [Candidatus Lokiarchaeota archaeon]MBD3200531.1 flavin reductase family protein [Candidatus Lokiarchaeota archaeon]